MAMKEKGWTSLKTKPSLFHEAADNFGEKRWPDLWEGDVLPVFVGTSESSVFHGPYGFLGPTGPHDGEPCGDDDGESAGGRIHISVDIEEAPSFVEIHIGYLRSHKRRSLDGDLMDSCVLTTAHLTVPEAERVIAELHEAITIAREADKL